MRLHIIKVNVIEENISVTDTNEGKIIKVPFVHNQQYQDLFNDICNFNDVSLDNGELFFTFMKKDINNIGDYTYKIYPDNKEDDYLYNGLYDGLFYYVPDFMFTNEEIQYINTLYQMIS